MHLTGYALVLNSVTNCERISLAECEIVAEQLGVPFVTQDTTGYPPYCGIHEGEEMYFNNRSTSTYECDREDFCVCHPYDPSSGAPAPGLGAN